MGCGPDHWPLHAHEFGWPAGKEAHSLWVQTSVELGVPGIMMFLGFYLVTIWRSWLLLQRMKHSDELWFTDAARMTIASLIGFIVAAQFVSLEALEIPYYVALLGAGSMAVHQRMYGVRESESSEHENVYEATPAIAWTAAASAPATAYGFFDSGSLTTSSVIEDRPTFNRHYMNSDIVPVPRAHANSSVVAVEPRPAEETPLPSGDWRESVGTREPATFTEERQLMVMN